MKAYIYPGQGAQFEGMGKDLYDSHDLAKEYFDAADDIVGFKLSDVMFNGSAEDLKKTSVTQPAIFLHSIVKTKMLGENFTPSCVAGHSLGEFSALVAAESMSFNDGLALVQKRADAMQRACTSQESTMAAIVGLDNKVVEQICSEVDEVVVPANYNCPGQLVISGSIQGVKKACHLLKEAGARRALVLQVGGAFHSPLMEMAREELADAIEGTDVKSPICPIYQNVSGKPEKDPSVIKINLVRQLTSPVRWAQTMENMLKDGVNKFVEVGGRGGILAGMVKKIDRSLESEIV